jgi:hypothetical protein
MLKVCFEKKQNHQHPKHEVLTGHGGKNEPPNGQTDKDMNRHGDKYDKASYRSKDQRQASKTPFSNLSNLYAMCPAL